MYCYVYFQHGYDSKKTMRKFIDRKTPVRDAKARENMEKLRRERTKKGLPLDNRPLVWSTMDKFPAPELKPDD